MRRGAVFCAALALASVGGLLGPRSAARAQEGLLSRTPLTRTIVALTSPDARVRREAAARLGLIGPHDAVAAPLTTAIEHEPVPETLATMIDALARRADPSDLPALEAAWDRAAVAERRTILSALDEIGTEATWPILRRHLASEGVSPRACAALVRTEERVRWLASTLDDPSSRDRVVSCLASAEPSPTRDAGLLRAGLDLEPTSAREVLDALARSEQASEAAIAMAEAALARPDPTWLPPALAMLARHAPERVPMERWQSAIGLDDDRAASALRALLTLAPSVADETLARVRSGSPSTARRALAVLLDRHDPADLTRIALLTEVAETRTAALDALAARDGGASVLATLPAAPDVDLALALARPTGVARTTLLARSPSLLVRALVSDVDADGCAPASASVEERTQSAACLAILGAHAAAARALETERDASVVGWLALAARGAAVSFATVSALLDDPETRLAALSLVVPTLAAISPSERRALERRLVSATTDDDESARAEALWGLGRLGHAAHRAIVVAALEDPSPCVRVAAARALSAVGVETGTDLRVVGRAHVETDPHVLAALRREPVTTARAPLHVHVEEHDSARSSAARVVVWLADGRALRLSAVRGEIVVPDVPDGPAVARLESAP